MCLAKAPLRDTMASKILLDPSHNSSAPSYIPMLPKRWRSITTPRLPRSCWTHLIIPVLHLIFQCCQKGGAQKQLHGFQDPVGLILHSSAPSCIPMLPKRRRSKTAPRLPRPMRHEEAKHRSMTKKQTLKTQAALWTDAPTKKPCPAKASAKKTSPDVGGVA